MNSKLTKKSVSSNLLNLFKKLINIYPDNPSTIINKILNTTTALRREGKNIDNIKESDFEEIFMYLKNKEISKEAIEEIMIMKADHPELTIIEIKERLRELETHGILIREVFNDVIPVKVEYSLAKPGRDLEDIFERISIWARNWITS